MALHTHLGAKGATLTTNHAASSYGMPVLVVGGSCEGVGAEVYGPGDLPAGTTLVIDELFSDHAHDDAAFAGEVAAARSAGFRLAPVRGE